MQRPKHFVLCLHEVDTICEPSNKITDEYVRYLKVGNKIKDDILWYLVGHARQHVWYYEFAKGRGIVQSQVTIITCEASMSIWLNPLVLPKVLENRTR